MYRVSATLISKNIEKGLLVLITNLNFMILLGFFLRGWAFKHTAYRNVDFESLYFSAITGAEKFAEFTHAQLLI
jgi:hypothetical protein